MWAIARRDRAQIIVSVGTAIWAGAVFLVSGTWPGLLLTVLRTGILVYGGLQKPKQQSKPEPEPGR